MGYVYKITHNESGKWYIGSHDGSNPNYFGSGIMLKRAIEKYGIESFSKEILYEGPSYRNEEERILKELDAANDPQSYNLKNEALGGSFPGELNGMYGKKLTDEHRYQCGSAFRGKKRPDHSLKMSGKNNPMFGKSAHSHGLIKRAKERTGKTNSEFYGEEKAKQISLNLSKSHKGKKYNLLPKKCPHCGREGKGPNMGRYHFDNCKYKHQEDGN